MRNVFYFTWKRYMKGLSSCTISSIVAFCLHDIKYYCMRYRDMLFSHVKPAAPFHAPWSTLMVVSTLSWLLPLAFPAGPLWRISLALHLVRQSADCFNAAVTHAY